MLQLLQGPDFQQTLAFFDDLARRAPNLRDVLQQAVEAYEDQVEDAFNSEGPGWAQHKELTVRLRAEKGTSGPILDETSALRESFRTGGPDHIEKWGGDFVETGSGRKYAGPHQHGFSNRGSVRVTDRKTGRRIPIKFNGKRVAARPILTQRTDNAVADRFIQALFNWLRI